MTTLTYQRTLKLEVVECCTCHVEYGIPAEMNAQAIRDKDRVSIYCPNGHSWHYTGQDLEAQLRSARARIVSAEDQARAAERRAAAARGQVTKLRRRVANGVCPCCHRTFAQLKRHMESQHPGYKAETDG